MSEAVDHNPFAPWPSAVECYSDLYDQGVTLSVKDDTGTIWFTSTDALTEFEVESVREGIATFRGGLLSIIRARDGLQAPADPVLATTQTVAPSPEDIHADFLERGFRLRVDGGTLVVSPSSQLTAEDAATLRAHKPALLDIVGRETPPGPQPTASPPSTCVRIDVGYDEGWKAEIKAIPPPFREWRPDEDVWVVWQPHCDKAIAITERYFPSAVKYGDAIRWGSDPPKPGPLTPFNVTTMPAPIPADTRASVWDKTGGLCWYCGTRLVPHRTFHVDHVHPRSDGGTDDLVNLVPACPTCNTDKGALLLETFRLKRGGGLFWFEIVRAL